MQWIVVTNHVIDIGVVDVIANYYLLFILLMLLFPIVLWCTFIDDSLRYATLLFVIGFSSVILSLVRLMLLVALEFIACGLVM